MTDPPWLDDEEQRAWRAFVGATHHLQVHIHGPLQTDAGLSAIDYAALVMLSESPGYKARMSEIGDAAGASSSQLAYRMDRLVKLGFVEREPCETDRRGSMALLTDEGLAALEEAAALHVATVRAEVIDRLDRDELVEFGRLLEKMTAHRRP